MRCASHECNVILSEAKDLFRETVGRPLSVVGVHAVRLAWTQRHPERSEGPLLRNSWRGRVPSPSSRLRMTNALSVVGCSCGAPRM